MEAQALRFDTLNRFWSSGRKAVIFFARPSPGPGGLGVCVQGFRRAAARSSRQFLDRG